jgi:hypothetical protein
MAVGLVETLSVARREWENDVIGRAIERFEQRLTNQVADVKIAVGGMQATLREEIAGQKVELFGLVTRQGADLRSEMAAGRTDLLRWLFVFWTGQLIALAALLKTLG